MGGQRGAAAHALSPPLPYITLLTDFGDRDGYVGAMQGVLFDLVPDVRVIDIAHGLPAGQILPAAFSWLTSLVTFPAGGIHVAVVDPGVGTDRRALAIEGPWGTWICPDNGVVAGFLDPAIRSALARAFDPVGPDGPSGLRAVSLDDPAYQRPAESQTFHGRDIFAPAAGHLARGVSLGALGSDVDLQSLAELPELRPIREPQISGVVAAVDRFGNLRTNIPKAWLPASPRVTLTGRNGTAEIDRQVTSFGMAPPGAALLTVGSAGTLEVAVRDGSAAARFGTAAGDKVSVVA